jgi:hypothetical protein
MLLLLQKTHENFLEKSASPESTLAPFLSGLVQCTDSQQISQIALDDHYPTSTFVTEWDDWLYIKAKGPNKSCE